MHAVERNRALAARALGYACRRGPDYGIRAAAGEFAWLPRGPYAVLLHATSQERKLWPEAALDRAGPRARARAAGAACCRGMDDGERARSERLAREIPGRDRAARARARRRWRG